MSSDQTEAATITPEANPNRAFCNRAGISSFIRKTNPDPSIVPNKGIKRPIIFTIWSFTMYHLFCQLSYDILFEVFGFSYRSKALDGLAVFGNEELGEVPKNITLFLDALADFLEH